MSLYALNRALQSHTLVWRRLFVIFAAVVAVLGGLLAMHSFSTHTDHGSTVAAAEGAHVAAAEGTHGHGATDTHESGSHAMVADDCADGLCTPGHSSELTACLLALLVATIILAIRSVPGRALLLLIVALASARRQMSVARPARPPSLVALSISRT